MLASLGLNSYKIWSSAFKNRMHLFNFF